MEPDPVSWRFEPIAKRHDRSNFICGVPEYDTWIQRYASQNQRQDSARVFVCVRGESPVVWAYYALASTEIDASLLKESERKNLPPRIPATLIARLAIHKDLQGNREVNLATFTLLDAFARAQHAAEFVAARFVVTQPLDERACRFYAKHEMVRIVELEPEIYAISLASIRKLGLPSATDASSS